VDFKIIGVYGNTPGGMTTIEEDFGCIPKVLSVFPK